MPIFRYSFNLWETSFIFVFEKAAPRIHAVRSKKGELVFFVTEAPSASPVLQGGVSEEENRCS